MLLCTAWWPRGPTMSSRCWRSSRSSRSRSSSGTENIRSVHGGADRARALGGGPGRYAVMAVIKLSPGLGDLPRPCAGAMASKPRLRRSRRGIADRQRGASHWIQACGASFFESSRRRGGPDRVTGLLPVPYLVRAIAGFVLASWRRVWSRRPGRTAPGRRESPWPMPTLWMARRLSTLLAAAVPIWMAGAGRHRRACKARTGCPVTYA